MVNAPRMHQERKAIQIAQMISTIKQMQEKGMEIDKTRMVLATMAELNLSKPTARDYVDIAFYKLGLK